MKKLFCLFFVCFLFPVKAQTYTITEQELQIIEKYKVKSEMEKQNWLSQTKTLNQQIIELKNESTTLNQQVTTLSNQLQNQREVNKRLENSYNQLEIDQSQKINDLLKFKDKFYKLKNGFFILLSITIIESVLIIIYIIYKIKLCASSIDKFIA